jgi:ubiquinone/menaquinone biosynthesis C-methylase UbiE
VNRLFIDDLLAAGEIRGDILDLGTGTAQIPIVLCERLDELGVEDYRVMAADLSTSMLDLARYNIEVRLVTHRVQLDHVDAKALHYEDGMFDIVISNSIVHHIPKPAEALREALRVVRPGGLLFFRDLLRPEEEADVARLVETYAGDDNEHQRQMFEDSLRAALSLEEIRELVASLGFNAETVQATSDRHWTWLGRPASV